MSKLKYDSFSSREDDSLKELLEHLIESNLTQAEALDSLIESLDNIADLIQKGMEDE